MMNRRSLLIALGFAAALGGAARGQDSIAGTWNGTLPKADLPLVFKFKADGSGTVDSPKQNFKAAATVSLDGNNVTISVPAVQGTFTGTLEDERMTGTWKQGSGYSDSLELEKE